MARLQLPKTTQPTRENTLKNTISREFHGQLAEADLAAVVTAMVDLGFVTINNGKVVFKRNA